MHYQSADALLTLRQLVERGYCVALNKNDEGMWSVRVEWQAGLRPRWYDAGTLDDALLQIRLTDYPARAA